jgi:very-long-chain enoyl-CoA reductase
MVLPEWTLGNIIIYGGLALAVLVVMPLELAGRAMMEYGRFRGAKGISSRSGMLLIYGAPLVFLVIGALPYLSSPSTHQLILFAALFIHFAKRTLEVLFVHKYSGTMNQMTAIFIAAFYSLTTFLPAYMNRQALQSADALTYLGVLIFVYSEFVNFIHHKILRDLRQNTMDYVIPHGGLFGRVVCPHFLFEIISWFGMFLIFRHLSMFLFFAFTATYLTARSLRTLKWYRGKFPDFPKNRKAILPFIL